MTDDEYTPTTGTVRAGFCVGNGFPTMTRLERGRAFDRWLAEHDAEVAAIIVDRIRKHCTPSVEAYAAGGDAVILAVADWILDPPEWVKAPWMKKEHDNG